MTYRGHVKNGHITLDEPASLPEGAQVSVQVLGTVAGSLQRLSRRDILHLPVGQRRQLLTEQAESLASLYPSDDEARLEWQGGDLVE